MIWLIGGTRTSANVAQALAARDYPYVVTVTTAQAQRLYHLLPGTVVVTTLTLHTISAFLAAWSIHQIIDASHPFAVEISQLAMATAQHYQLQYLRFERPRVELDPAAELVPEMNTVLQATYFQGQRVLLTVGVKALPAFQSWALEGPVWARILPSSQTLAESYGFPAHQLILGRPPFTAKSETELWTQYAFDRVITKASGQDGGLDIKQAVALKLGIRLTIIDRPAIQYPYQTSDLQQLLNRLELGDN